MDNSPIRFMNRELSWLSFNHRVLQEAADPSVPLYERIKFLAIFSSNLDEFFRVRVASVRALEGLKKKKRKDLGFEPAWLLKQINKTVIHQQEEFGRVFRNDITAALEKEGIRILREGSLDGEAIRFVKSLFQEKILGSLAPVFLGVEKEPPFLENRQIYLCVALEARERHNDRSKGSPQYALIEIPTHAVPRFVTLPSSGGQHDIMFVDDVIRMNLSAVFPNHDVLGAYSIKMTRDAELYIDDEFSGDLVQKIKTALQKRKAGVLCRFLYDVDMPGHMRKLLKRLFHLGADDLVEGARYHNFHDLFSLPNPKDPDLTYQPMEPLRVPSSRRFIEEVLQRDQLLFYPYHSYETVIQFLSQAADDPRVVSVKITLYRVARNSRVIEELLKALRSGKQVTVFVEVKARFDEESNLYWASELEKAGAKVLYSFPGLKVHAKLCLVTLEEQGKVTQVAYLSTGNFNENAARIYTDFGLFTADVRLTKEVAVVFDVLSRRARGAEFEHLLVAPFVLRSGFVKLIDREIKNARKGNPASIIAKMNSLEDSDMITKLYEASEKGVAVHLIIRGICCLTPEVKGMSENIKVISIVDRFLEHARVFIFHNGGNPMYYLSSADWMRRNLSQRIEVAFPIYDPSLQGVVNRLVQLQLADTAKARIIDKNQTNALRTAGPDSVRSQYATHEYLKSLQ
ncbi:MAG: polyphosphate kinase 1 [Bacteroidota bacterium]